MKRMVYIDIHGDTELMEWNRYDMEIEWRIVGQIAGWDHYENSKYTDQLVLVYVGSLKLKKGIIAAKPKKDQSER